MKFASVRPYADPAAAARKLLEIANGIEPGQQCQIYRVDQLSDAVSRLASPTEYGAGLSYAIDKGLAGAEPFWNFVKFTPAGADLFA